MDDKNYDVTEENKESLADRVMKSIQERYSNENNKVKDVSQSTNLFEIVEAIKQLNPGVEIRVGNPSIDPSANERFYSSVPVEQLNLPYGFYYNEKNGITNKHKTESGLYCSLRVEDLSLADESTLAPEKEEKITIDPATIDTVQAKLKKLDEKGVIVKPAEIRKYERKKPSKPIKFPSFKFDMIKKVREVLGTLKSKFASLRERFGEKFEKAVTKTYESDELPQVVERNEIDRDLEEVAKKDIPTMPNLANMISAPETEEKIQSEREKVNAWVEEQTKKNVDELEKTRVKASGKPIKKPTPYDLVDEKPIDFSRIFKEPSNEIDEPKKETEKTPSVSETSNEELTQATTTSKPSNEYEEKIAALKKEIAEKQAELKKQKEINKVTQEAIDAQNKITKKVLKSNDALQAENERIQQENIASLERIAQSTTSEYEEALDQKKKLDEELETAKQNSSSASEKMQQLQAENDALKQAQREIAEMLGTPEVTVNPTAKSKI